MNSQFLERIARMDTDISDLRLESERQKKEIAFLKQLLLEVKSNVFTNKSE